LRAKVKVAFDGLVATFLKAQGVPKKSHEFAFFGFDILRRTRVVVMVVVVVVEEEV